MNQQKLKQTLSPKTEAGYRKSGNTALKRIFAFLLSMAIVMPLLTVPAFAKTPFTDMKGNEWFAKDVIALAANANEIIKGYPDGSFGPNHTLTVDQFITMLVRAAGEKAEINSEYWAINYLNKAKDMGILKDGDFDDYRAGITREQMAVLMIRWLEKKENLEGMDTTMVEKAVMDYVLVGAYAKGGEETIKDEYQNAVKKAYVLGLLTGYDDTTFKPQGILIRAEAATVIIRMMDTTRRTTFRPEELQKKREAEMTEHYYKGSKWVDPTDKKISILKNAEEDRMLTTSDMVYYPSINTALKGELFGLSIDEVAGTIWYDEKGAKPGQVEDFRRLLLRRMPGREAEIVMQFLREKKDINTYLKYPRNVFRLKNNEYSVYLEEIPTTKGHAYTVTFNIWYRDEKWKQVEEEYAPRVLIRNMGE